MRSSLTFTAAPSTGFCWWWTAPKRFGFDWRNGGWMKLTIKCIYSSIQKTACTRNVSSLQTFRNSSRPYKNHFQPEWSINSIHSIYNLIIWLLAILLAFFMFYQFFFFEEESNKKLWKFLCKLTIFIVLPWHKHESLSMRSHKSNLRP